MAEKLGGNIGHSSVTVVTGNIGECKSPSSGGFLFGGIILWHPVSAKKFGGIMVGAAHYARPPLSVPPIMRATNDPVPDDPVVDGSEPDSLVTVVTGNNGRPLVTCCICNTLLQSKMPAKQHNFTGWLCLVQRNRANKSYRPTGKKAGKIMGPLEFADKYEGQENMTREVSVLLVETIDGYLLARAEGDRALAYCASRTTSKAIGRAASAAAYGDFRDAEAFETPEDALSYARGKDNLNRDYH